MSYYIIVRATGLIATDGPNKSRSYKTYGAARATRTRLCNKSGWSVAELSIVDTQHYKVCFGNTYNLNKLLDFQITNIPIKS